MTPVTVVEIDLPICTRTYGVSPCTAAVGVTGTRKCFNTLRTCQDRANFNRTLKTVRFCPATMEAAFRNGGEPVEVIPSMTSIRITPTVINPGVDIGTRETVAISLEDHPHSDAGYDKYLDDRTYNPFLQGTFWGKLRARYPSFEGYNLRVKRGEYGQDLSEMRTYHYVIDGLSGQGESVSLSAKDVLILTDQKKAQAPLISSGVLAADIDADDMSFSLSPPGIGNLEYPTSGKLTIAGKEAVTFTRSGDTVTITQRGVYGEAQAHDLGDSVQVVLTIPPSTVSSIVQTLLVDYTPGINPDWIDIASWEAEVDEYIDRLYDAEIAVPTSVVTLLNELIEQAGLILWWDPEAQQIKLRSLRPVTPGAQAITDDVMIEGTPKLKEQPQKRISEIWTYFGVRNPLEKLDNTDNYRVTVAAFDAEASQDYEQPAIKKVFSRWINVNNRSAAVRLNSMQLARYRDAPRRIMFSLHATYETEPKLGDAILVNTWLLQDDTGSNADTASQIVSVERREEGYIVDSQEALYSPQDDAETTHLIYIDTDSYNVNLRTIHDSIYASIEPEDVVRCIISTGVTVGSTNRAFPAFDVGSWPEGQTIEIVNNGRIQGKGGKGDSFTTAAEAGGTALYTRADVSFDNSAGQIWGGGGGGGAAEFTGDWAGGGGGAGTDPGAGGSGNLGAGSNGFTGTTEEGGHGGALLGFEGTFASAGGDPGEAGVSNFFGTPRTGGAAGNGVDGDSYVTFTSEGSILGPRIN